MAAATTIRVLGLDKLDRRLGSLPPKIQNKVIRKGLRVSGNRQKKRLKAGTPRLTGFSARQVRLKVQVSLTKAFARLGYKGRARAWMRMRDTGTKRQPARPYFDRALAGWEGQTERDFKVAVREAVESL